MAGDHLTPKFITFDLYGTLTNFQMSDVTARLMADRVDEGDMGRFLDDFEAFRGDEVLGTFKPYAQVITESFRRTCDLWNMAYDRETASAIVDAVPTWGPHPDVPEALARTAEAYPLVILSNANDEQIRHNVDKLGAPFHAVYTAEQARSYKPCFAAFEYMLDQLGCQRHEILHVSASLYYDLMPCHHMRIVNKVYVNRGYEPSVPFFGYHEIPDITHLPGLLGL